ncbi:MAG: FAD-dependent oxidoreductase [Myxococcales bacterium]|nr:FAD-dependent oxidoreductase [Myxococcales bacterium]
MSRTPLFRTLRRALRAARLANSDRPNVEGASTSWSRREILRTGAVSAMGLAVGCRRPHSSGSSPGTVAVVGAGIAGLTCAWRLTQQGIPVRIFEAQARVGGRMWSLRDHFPEGQVCELGGELIDSNHATMFRLCREFEIELFDFAEDTGVSQDVWYFDGRSFSEAEVVEAFRPIAAQIDAAWEAIEGDDVTALAPNGGESIDQMSLAQWLDSAGSEGWFRALLEVAYVTEYGSPIEDQSPWNLLALIDSNPDPFRIFGDSDERYKVAGGNDLVPTRLGERLEASIELGQRLEAVHRSADGRYRLRFGGDGGSQEVTADRVVLAIPFTTLRDVDLAVDLPPAKRRAIDELGYGTNAKLMVGFSERIWRTKGGSNGSVLTDLPFQLSWESTRLQPGAPGIVVGYTGGPEGVAMGQGTADEQAARFAELFDRVFPGVAAVRGQAVRFHWPSFAWTKASYACYRPGQWTTIRGYEGTAVDGLHFAGEHTSLDFQGYMEGGAESGERAAREVAESLGRG